jgi:hypothetical protein
VTPWIFPVARVRKKLWEVQALSQRIINGKTKQKTWTTKSFNFSRRSNIYDDSESDKQAVFNDVQPS